MRRIFAVLAAVAVFASGSAEAARAAEADVVSFTAENVSAIVREAGASNVSVEKADEITFINFEFGGLPFSYSIRLCGTVDAKPACMGLLMAIGFQTTERYSLETVNGFNKVVPIATAVSVDSDKIAFGRMLFSVGGLTRDNIKANMGLMAAVPVIFSEYLKAQVVASSGTGTEARLSAVAAPAGEMKAVRLTAAEVKALFDDKMTAKLVP